MHCVRQKQDVLHADIVHGAFAGQKATPEQKPLRDVSVALGQWTKPLLTFFHVKSYEITWASWTNKVIQCSCYEISHRIHFPSIFNSLEFKNLTLLLYVCHCYLFLWVSAVACPAVVQTCGAALGEKDKSLLVLEELNSLVLINSEFGVVAWSVVPSIGLAARPKPWAGRKFRPTEMNPKGKI